MLLLLLRLLLLLVEMLVMAKVKLLLAALGLWLTRIVADAIFPPPPFLLAFHVVDPAAGLEAHHLAAVVEGHLRLRMWKGGVCRAFGTRLVAFR